MGATSGERLPVTGEEAVVRANADDGGLSPGGGSLERQKLNFNENCIDRLSMIVEVMRPAVGESKF